MQTSLVLDWADGSYDFKLTWAGCGEIERRANAGIQAIYERVMVGQSHRADVVEIIRQGLAGGTGGKVDGENVETTPPTVAALMDRYVTGPDARPFTENWVVAKAVMHAYMVGYEPPKPKKPAQKKTAAPRRTAST